MNNRFALGLLLTSLIILSTTMSTVSATDYTKVGVKVGDTADYSYSNPTGNGTIRIHILQITGANVTISIHTIYSNGSEGPNNIVSTNLSAITPDFSAPYKIISYLVAANLSQGDPAIPEDTPTTICETTTMNVAGLNRTVNHVRYAFWITYPINNSGSWGGGCIVDCYWDKITGLAVKTNTTITGEFAIRANYSEGNYVQTLTSTTAFTTQSTEQDPIVLLATTGAITIVLVAIAIAAIAQKKQKASRP